MLKNISELKNKPKEYQKEFFDKCRIEEKIDAHYVSVSVESKFKLVFRKANGKVISQVDLILSTLYSSLVEDWNIIFINNREFFEKNIGMTIFMFYFPNTNPVSIDYSNFLNGKKTGYLISNVVDRGNKQISKEYFLKNINCDKRQNVFIAVQHTLPRVNKRDDVPIDDLSVIDMFEESGLLNKSIDLSEGVILKYKTDIYQYLFHESSEKDNAESASKTPFEYLLADIVAFYKSIKNDFQDYLTNNYVTTICNIFNAYVGNQVITSNITKEIEVEDIEVPSSHKYGINLSYIPNIQTKLICSSSKMFENIFKVMLANMNKKKNFNYCVYLSKKQVEEWNNMVDIIIRCLDCDF